MRQELNLDLFQLSAAEKTSVQYLLEHPKEIKGTIEISHYRKKRFQEFIKRLAQENANNRDFIKSILRLLEEFSNLPKTILVASILKKNEISEILEFPQKN